MVDLVEQIFLTIQNSYIELKENFAEASMREFGRFVLK